VKAIVEKENAGKPAASVARAVAKARDERVKIIQDTAVELKCTTGKWMLFPHATDINAIWSVIVRSTVLNELGIAAKVAPDNGDDRSPRLICIYTIDFTDIEDVTKVLRKLKDLGLVETKGRPIYYKCDAYTHLDIKSGNEWGIKASLYSSADLLKPKEQKLDAFFKKKKK